MGSERIGNSDSRKNSNANVGVQLAQLLTSQNTPSPIDYRLFRRELTYKHASRTNHVLVRRCIPHQAGRGSAPYLVAVLLVLLCGCSTASFFYNHSDTIAAHYLESLVPLDPQQQSKLHLWLKQELEWHRATQVEKYVVFLTRVEHQLAAPASLTAYLDMQRTVESFAREFAAHAAAQAVPQLAALTPLQVNELFDNLDKNERKQAAKRARRSPDRMRDDREKRAVRMMVTWSGEITDEQRSILKAAISRLSLSDREQQDARRQWRRALQQATLQLRNSNDQQRLKILLAHPEQSYPAEYRARDQRDTQLIIETLVAIDKSLTNAQRERLREKLRALIEDLTTLRS